MCFSLTVRDTYRDADVNASYGDITNCEFRELFHNPWRRFQIYYSS